MMELIKIDIWVWLLSWPIQLSMLSPPWSSLWVLGHSCTSMTYVGHTDKSGLTHSMCLIRCFSGKGHFILTLYWLWGVLPAHIFVNESPLLWPISIILRGHLPPTILTISLVLPPPRKLIETSASWDGSCKILGYGSLSIRLVPRHPSWLCWGFFSILLT